MKAINKVIKYVGVQLFNLSWKLYRLVDMLPVYLRFQEMSYETKLKLDRTRRNVYRSDSVHMNRYIEVKC